MQKKTIIILLTIFSIIFSMVTGITPTKADSLSGAQIITLGKDLSVDQREKVLTDLQAPNDVTIVEVSNKEEHQYLGGSLPEKVIGTKAISSSLVTFKEQGSGLSIESSNITWVSNEMYINALTTAGISDADIKVTAPFSVSGTAALTGIIKAFEQATGKDIGEEVKKVANEEMIRTAQLADQIGDKEKAVEFMQRIKEELSKQGAKLSDEQLKELITKIANDLNITISDQEMNSLISLLRKLQNTNIDWDLISHRIDQTKNSAKNYLDNNPEAKGFIKQVVLFLKSIIEKILSWLG